MFRQATRLIARPSGMRAIPRASAPARRFLSTAPPTQKSRSWKSLVARLGVAGAIIYYYNTTEVFAEEPKLVVQSLPETHEETELLPTFESLAQEREKRKADLLAAQEKAAVEAKAKEAQATSVGGVEGLEEEADQQGAFNPETGEINWDCPCLGGMANGPCGEEFKAAFSCFIFSTEEPKGMDCIENFKHMQNCFRQYPEVYGAELDQDEEDDVPADGELSAATATETPATELSNVASQPASESSKLNESQDERGLVPKSYRSGVEQTEDSKAQAKRQVESLSESEDERIIPKAAQDEGDAKLEKK